MRMIDTHCHLDVSAFADDVDHVVARATAAGVIGMLVPAIRPSMWPALAALVERHRGAGLRLAIGIHPQIVPELAPGEIGRIENTRDASAGAEGKYARDTSAGVEGEYARDTSAGVEREYARDATGAESERIHDATSAESEHVDAPSADSERVHDANAVDIDAVAAWIARASTAYRAVAIGECGLDGATGDMPRQEALFRAHIRAARITGLPLVIHVLRAHDLAPRVLREELARPLRDPVRQAGSENRGASPVSGALPSVSSPRIVGVLHSYSGGADLVDVYRELGLAFSFAGPVSYANARKPVEAARAIPPELLLAETDAPDQAPEGHRGGRSEPAFVAAVIAGLAAARKTTAEEIAALTTANAKRIFRSWHAGESSRE